jgi:hypothetical protein
MERCTIILDVVASHALWIWHSFFGIAWSHNDINMLSARRYSLGMQKHSSGYEINSHAYNKAYYLAESIYLDWSTLGERNWSTLRKTIRAPKEEKNKRFINNKKLARGMWSGNLVCCNLVVLLFGKLLEHGALTPCGR